MIDGYAPLYVAGVVVFPTSTWTEMDETAMDADC